MTRLTRARPYTRNGTQEKTPQWKHWHHLHPVCQRRHNEYANQQRKEAGHSTASKRLDTSSRPGQKASIPRHRPDVSQTRHCHPVNWYKAPCHCGTDSTLGGKMPERIWIEKKPSTPTYKLCTESGWQTWLFPVEVGCRGSPAQAMWTTLSSLGIVGRQRRAAVKALGQAAERASIWLWLKRDQENWKLSNEG